MMSFDNGDLNAYGGFPIFQCSSLNSNPSCKQNGWSGSVHMNRGQFCDFKFEKKNNKTCMHFNGYHFEKP